MPKKPSQNKDANQIAFGGLQELLRRDEERDQSKPAKTPSQQIKKPSQKKQRIAS